MSGFIFYCPDIASSPVLPESDSAHAVRVLRMGEGAPLRVVDGKGTLYECVLASAHPKKAVVEVVRALPMPNPWQGKLTVAVAPTKMMDRMEWMVEKLTEIGIDRIIPLRCERSERKEIKVERLEKVAVAAMKQSLKGVLPIISPMTPLAEVVKEAHGQRFMAWCSDEHPRLELSAVAQAGADATLLIGPEGDFSPREAELALAGGFVPVTLGPCRLRTETAALMGVHTLHLAR